MNMVERIKAICKERKIPISKLEKECGFANGYISQLKKGTMPADRLRKCAEYLNVDSEYLMGSENIVNDTETHTWDYAQDAGYHQADYYQDPATAKLAEFLHKNPEYAILFDATTRVKPKDIKLALRAIGLFIEEENDD